MINNRVIILDISFWQDNNYTPYRIDFNKSWVNGADGVIIRAGQNTWIDEDYLDNCRNADRAGLPRGAYWFYDSRLSPIPQADLFADIVSISGFPPLGIWGDYEENYGGLYGGEANFRLFMDRLATKFPGKLIGVYTGPSYWNTKTTAAGRNYFKKFPLWVANYKVLFPTIPAPWTEYALWQYTAEGDGAAFGAESQEIDINLFRGTLEQYKSMFGLVNYEPYLGQPPQGDGMLVYRIKSTATPHVNLREDADQSSEDLGNMFPNEEFLVDGSATKKDSFGRDWLRSVEPGRVGYVLASLCEFVRDAEDPEPEPEPETHVLEVYLDGNLEYRKEF